MLSAWIWQQHLDFTILHIYCNCDCRVPIIGGRDLDLHKLFVEVTCRGGINKVSPLNDLVTYYVLLEFALIFLSLLHFPSLNCRYFMKGDGKK